MRGWVAFVLLCAAQSLPAADARWRRMDSTDFEMYTTASDRSARDTLRYFEQVHGFFAQMTSPPGAQGAAQTPEKSADPKAARPPADKVRLIAFDSLKQFDPYRFNEFATAYYHTDGIHDFIVMSQAGPDTFPVAIHEYVHLVARHSKLNLPPWLGEGIAEFYSTLQPRGDRILIGSLVPGRYQALLRERWVPLQTILTADHNSDFYNEKAKAGSLYNEGWALTHMLALSAEYRNGFPQLVRTISAGTPSIEALEKIYSKPLAAIEKDLINYLRGGRFQGVLIGAKLDHIDEDLKAEPANDIDVALLLCEISDRPGREQETRDALEALIARDPNRAEAHVDLAYLALRLRVADFAREHFSKAFELGSRDSRMLWDYGRMTEAVDLVRSKQVLGELLKQEPDRLDVRMELASVELRPGGSNEARIASAKQAIETLAPVKKVTPADAPRLLTLIAYAHYQAGNRQMAHDAALQLKSLSTATAEDRNRADQILQATTARPDSAQAHVLDDRGINGSTSPGTTTVSPRSITADPGDPVPVLRHRDPGASSVTEVYAKPPARPAFSGNFVALDCGDSARIIIDTSAGRRTLFIDDPTKLLVNGHNGETRELICGPQRSTKIRVEYDAPANAPKGTDGIARVIHFE